MLETISDETVIDRISGDICRQIKMEDNDIGEDEYSYLSSEMVKYIDVNFVSNFEYEITYDVPKKVVKISIDNYINPELTQEKLFKEEEMLIKRVNDFKTAYNQFKDEFNK